MAVVVSGWAVEVARVLLREIVLLVADHCSSRVEKVVRAISPTEIGGNDEQTCVCLGYQKMKKLKLSDGYFKHYNNHVNWHVQEALALSWA